ncbi:hypothetical protein KAH81_04690 [bacterium]|nr:hypothetical protein [bacterium]
MNWETNVLFDINDLYDFESESLESLDRIDNRTAVKGILASRIRKAYNELYDGEILSLIKNPEVLREPAIFLNLHLVFNANSTGGGIYALKATQYSNKFESAIQTALPAIEFEGLEKSGVVLIR